MPDLPLSLPHLGTLPSDLIQPPGGMGEYQPCEPVQNWH